MSKVLLYWLNLVRIRERNVHEMANTGSMRISISIEIKNRGNNHRSRKG